MNERSHYINLHVACTRTPGQHPLSRARTLSEGRDSSEWRSAPSRLGGLFPEFVDGVDPLFLRRPSRVGHLEPVDACTGADFDLLVRRVGRLAESRDRDVAQLNGAERLRAA